MEIRRFVVNSQVVKWSLFLLLLAVVMSWAIRGVLRRANGMRPADTQASAFLAMAPGTHTKAVVLLETVAGKELKGRLLRRETDTVYRQTSATGSAIDAKLMLETSVVMGKPQDIVPGAIVQISGALDANHALETNQIVILTGYVHLLQTAR